MAPVRLLGGKVDGLEADRAGLADELHVRKCA